MSPRIRLTPELLYAATGCSADAAGQYAHWLDEACAAYGISASAERLAAFLAQIAHESGALRYVRELADGSAYEGRRDLGNTEPGDGKRYRGRGLIQTTGRSNYRAATQRLRARLARQVPDFEATPQALELPEWAAWSAADYWDSRRLNGYADRADFIGITRRINGGTNGLADRQRRWDLARRALAAQDRPPLATAAQTAPPPAGHAAPPSTHAPAPPAPSETAMPLPAALLQLAVPLASAVIQGFGSLARDKLSKELERHTDQPEVAQQIAGLVVDAAQAATGLPDPIAAVAAARENPELMQRVEQAAMAAMAQMVPLLERINAIEQGNLRAAREFNAGEPLLLDTPWLRLKFVHLLSLVFVSFAGWFVMDNWISLTSELKGAVITLMVIAGWNGVRDYWMGSSHGSAEKTAAMLTSAERGTQARR